jgi:endonuclease/exonuclease/phosphatase (EEP) superfamily protein YafD
MHNVAKIQAQGIEVEENSIIRALWGKYTMGMAVRAQQATMVAEQIAASPYPVIVCGDFNDVPYSYVYKTMLGDLEDGFKECGKGFMFTYRGAKSVRIDYIFHDKSLDGIDYYKQNLSYSDHYPVYMEMAL